MRRYHIQDRDDYKKYNKLCGLITKVTSVLKQLDAKDPTRIEMTDQLLDKYGPLSLLPPIPAAFQRYIGSPTTVPYTESFMTFSSVVEVQATQPSQECVLNQSCMVA